MTRGASTTSGVEADEREPSGGGVAPVVLAAVAGMTLSAVLGWLLSAEHASRVRRSLDEQVAVAMEQLRGGVRMVDEKLRAVDSFYAASIEVTRREFEQFTAGGRANEPAVRYIAWVPLVDRRDRDEFESAAVRDGLTGFEFKELDEGGLKRAGMRDDYAPLYFVEPGEAYAGVLGVDLFSVPGRRAQLEMACDIGAMVTARVSGESESGRVVMARPVYRRGESVSTVEERRDALLGHVVAMVSLEGLLAPMQARLDAGIALELSSDGAPEAGPFHSTSATDLRRSDRRRSVTEILELGGERWRATFTPLPDYYASRPDAQTWIGVCLSLAFTTLVCAWIHSMAVRQRRVAAVVDERTSELIIANAAMQQEVRVRRRAEEALRNKTDELEEVNRELESFSYSISHDLRAPLRAITGFAGFVLRKHRERLPPDAIDHLEQVMKGGAQMNDLIEGLLEFSRVQRAELKRRACDMTEMARSVMAEALAAAPKRQVEVVWGRLPETFADPTLLRQVWQNLIGNALKYSAKRETAVIEIGARTAEDGQTEYYVGDNGAGFDMSQADRLFGVFQRFHSQSQFEGTGIGLANVHKIIQRHGGRISAEAEVDVGATFRFTLGRTVEVHDLDESAILGGEGILAS